MKHLSFLVLYLALGSLWAQEKSDKEAKEAALTAKELKVFTQIKEDLAKAQSDLNKQREVISQEKLEYSQKITEVKQERRQKQRQVSLVRRGNEAQEKILSELKKSDFSSTSEVQSLNQLLKAYGVSLQVGFLPGEKDDDRLEGIFSQNDDQNELLLSRFAALEAGFDRLDDALGGRVVEGEAADEDARMVKGKLAQFGPLGWFVANDQSASGEYVTSKSGSSASIRPIRDEGHRQLVTGGEALVTVDITGGKATALASIKDSPLDLFKKGGAWVFPIFGIALFALISAIIKFFQLSGMKQPGKKWLEDVVKDYLDGDQEAAMERVQKVKHPISQVLPFCISAVHCGIEVAEEVLYEKMIATRSKLKAWLPFIAITAATAPMLGLLGTVSGLIRTFSVITVEGTGEAQSISGGISEALITTLFGLTVAIPAFICHALLSRKAKGVEQTVERLSLGFMNEIRKGRSQ